MSGLWEAHSGQDYTVVMLPGETTDSASISVHGGHAPELAEQIAQARWTAVGLEHELADAETKAWDALSRYKFWMFGYWAAIWVHLNRVGRFHRPNPWLSIVRAAKAEMKRRAA